MSAKQKHHQIVLDRDRIESRNELETNDSMDAIGWVFLVGLLIIGFFAFIAGAV